MAKRKNVTEFGLAMVNKNSKILYQNQLGILEDSGISPHIYMVLLRPRPKVIINTFLATKTHFSCDVFFTQGGTEKKLNINIPHEYGTENIRIESEPPYTFFKIIDNANEEEVLGANVGWLLQLIDCGKNEVPLKVVYVGQSYGKTGERVAGDRLISHSTLQKVYSDIMSNEPDMEVLLYVSEFSCELVSTTFDKRVSNNISATQDDFDDQIDTGLVVNLVEGALIRYFQPKYNEKFKNCFPSKDHTSYQEAYSMDLNMLRVEVGSPYESFCSLYSDSKGINRHHVCDYHFHKLDERKSMLDFT